MRDPNIDRYLHEMAILFQNLGIDSSERDRDMAKQKEIQLIAEIARIDPEFASRLLHD